MEDRAPDLYGHRGFFKYLITGKIKGTIFPLAPERSLALERNSPYIVCNYNQKGFEGFLGTFCSLSPPLIGLR